MGANQPTNLRKATHHYRKHPHKLEKAHHKLSQARDLHSKVRALVHSKARIDPSRRRWTQIHLTQKTKVLKRNHKESHKGNHKENHKESHKCQLLKYQLQKYRL